MHPRPRSVLSAALIAATLWQWGDAAHILAESPTSTTAGSDLYPQILAIFKSKCTKCHGPDLTNPKGKFGYVTDLKRVSANPDFVIKFKPTESELYLLVRDDEMPPEDGQLPYLTDQEKQIVYRWIETGAVVPEPATITTKPKVQGWTRIRRWLGKFHPASAHQPLGLLFGAALAELLTILIRRVDLRTVARFCIILAAITAVATALLGWWNAESPVYAVKNSREFFLHRWLGVATAVVSVAAAVLSQWHAKRRSPGTLLVYRIALFSTAILASIVGFLGGVNVYGFNHYQW